MSRHAASGQQTAPLVAVRDAAAAQVAALQAQVAEVVAAAEGSNVDDEHDPEGHTIAFERQQLAALLDAARGRLADAERALTTSSYGTCERCGQPIGAERLEARPTARTCIGCARIAR